LLNTYIDSLPNYIEADGRIHATLVQTGAATGRFSSIDPNLQNLPAKIGDGVEVRKAFVAGKGKKFISLDYSQIDLRSAAMLSGDESLINIFRNGIDVHSGVAAIVYGKSEAEISSDERRHAKAINFGILYGMGVTALKDSMGVDRKTAK
jgi:DNA polymerase-1